jgi:hypothetical protein
MSYNYKRKVIYFIHSSLCLAVPAFADEGEYRFSVSVAPELNLYSVDKCATGGVLSGEYHLDTQFALGLKAGLFYAFDSAFTIEPMAFFRYYSIRLGPGQLFFQAEAGAALF